MAMSSSAPESAYDTHLDILYPHGEVIDVECNGELLATLTVER